MFSTALAASASKHPHELRTLNPFLMPNAEVCPIIMSNTNFQSDSTPAASLQLDYGRCSRRGREFWYARRAFLNSYHLSSEKNTNGSFKERLKRSVKELNEAAMGVVVDMHRGMSQRRIGIKTFRITVALPSWFLVRMRCFMPWLNKKKIM